MELVLQILSFSSGSTGVAQSQEAEGTDGEEAGEAWLWRRGTTGGGRNLVVRAGGRKKGGGASSYDIHILLLSSPPPRAINLCYDATPALL